MSGLPNRADADGVSLRVLLVNANFRDASVGGTQTFTQNLAASLVAAGHHVAVLCQGDDDSVEAAGGIEIFRIRPPRLALTPEPQWAYLVNQGLAIQNPAVAARVRTVLRRVRPDICHVQMLRRLTPTVLAVIQRAHTPVVQTVHEPFSLWNFNAFQRQDSPDKLYTRRPAVVGLLKARHRALSHRVDHVCAPSEVALRPYLQDGYFAGVPASVIANAVPFEWGDPELLAKERRRTRATRDVRFLLIGRLDYYKGVTTLLEALRHLAAPHIRLDVAGEGVLADRVRQEAASDPRITFHGPVHGEERRRLLREADALVCPSTWEEPFGLVVLEAYAAGLPVIASRVGALPELVGHSTTGLLVDAASAAALAGAMEQIRAPDLRHDLAESAAARASDFHPDTFLQRQLSIYDDVLARREGNQDAT